MFPINLSITQNRLPNNSLGLQALNIIIPSLYVGTQSVATYTYYSPTNTPENNLPIYGETLDVSGSWEIGSLLSSSIRNLVIPNGQSEGNHTYRWYRCTNSQTTGSVILGETNSYYLINSLDDGKFIRLEVDLVQTGGANLNGSTLYTLFLGRMSGEGFNPVVDLSWNSAFVHNDLVDFNTSSIWPNSGIGSNATQDGSGSLPIYNDISGALEFTRAGSQRLGIVNQNQTQPFEVWIKFRLKTLPGNQQLLGWSNSMYLQVNITGGLAVCGAPHTNVGLQINKDYTARIVVWGTSSTMEINHSGSIAIPSGVTGNGLGASAGQMGSSHSNNNYLDGFIYDYFINDNLLSASEQSSMWTWFGL